MKSSLKARVIPSATKETIRVPRFKKTTDGILEFRTINNNPLLVEIIYIEKSLGQYYAEKLNDVILIFFEKFAKFNNGTPDKIEEKLCYQDFGNGLRILPTEYTSTEIKKIIGLDEKHNIIRETCEKYNLKMKDLSLATGINENTLRSQASKNKINLQVETAIRLYIETVELKKELEIYKKKCKNL